MDNIDFSQDTPDGKNTVYGTVLVAFQNGNHIGNQDGTKLVLSGTTSRRSLKTLPESLIELLPCDIKSSSN